MLKIFQKKSKMRVLERRFDEVETSPRAPVRSYFVYFLMVNPLHASIWPYLLGKCLKIRHL